MAFDILSILRERAGENIVLHEKHINPAFAKVLRTIGFDVSYVRGQGQYLYDASGREYLDMLAGFGVFNVGRNHPTIQKALTDFIDSNHASLVKMEAPLLSGVLAEELKKRVPPNLEMVFFTNSGTEGMETAIKFARCATRKPRILYLNHAFHGLTYGALSLNGEQHFREGFDPLPGHSTAIELNDLLALEAELARGDVAAFVLEPIQGKGVAIARDDYLLAAAKACKRHGALLVLDEIQTGFGRTGKLFAMEYSGVAPDILVLSKSLSGGFVPVGAVMASREIFSKVYSSMERCFVHSSTFSQGGLAMAAGLATLHVIDEEKLAGNSARMGALLMEGLGELQKRFELIREIRGKGLMVGIEFGRPRSLALRIGWDVAHKVNSGIFGQAIVMPLMSDHGILTQISGHGGDVIKLIPPLVIGEADVARFLGAFEEVLERAHHFPGPIWEVATRLAKHAFKRRADTKTAGAHQVAEQVRGGAGL
jgi:acetylornithine/succinyldiaminopimelate/putrescine aminotransferase